SLSLLFSPSLRQSKELFAKVTGFLKRLDAHPAMDEDNKSSFSLTNGSRVVSLPGDPATVRGFSAPALIILDESAYVDDGLYAAIRPMLAVSEGRLILMSTPNGKRGHFYKAWQNDGDEWERFEVPASQCPRISSEYLEAEKRSLGEYRFKQEYQCEFVETIDQLFRAEDLDRAVTDTVKPLFPAIRGDGDVRPLFSRVA